MSIGQVIKLFSRRKLSSEQNNCANCWGTQEYQGTQHAAVYDRQIEVNNHTKKPSFIERFVRKNITGNYLQKEKSNGQGS